MVVSTSEVGRSKAVQLWEEEAEMKEHEEALGGDDVGGLGEGPVEFDDGVLD